MMIFITFGEMLAIPTAQAYAAALAPEDMRGRFMAVFGFTFSIPATFGTILAGVITKQWGPYAIWYLAAGVALLVACGFLVMYLARPAAQAAEVPATSSV